MPAVYSVSIHQEAGQNGTRVIPVPSGSVLVVRDIWTYWNTASALDAELFVEGDFGQTFWFWLYTLTSGDRIAFWQGRMVLQTSLTVRTTQPIDVSISGYHLTLP